MCENFHTSQSSWSVLVNKNCIRLSCHLSDTVMYLLTRKKSRNEENGVAVCTFCSTDLNFVKRIEENKKRNPSENPGRENCQSSRLLISNY